VPVASVTLQTVKTQGIPQSEAIANLKSAIDANQAVWFTYCLADEKDWGIFLEYWDEGADNAIIDLAKITEGHTLAASGGAHAVACVGYDDTDPEKPYWIILNSWGTGDSGNRTKGTFRMAMNTNYDAKIMSGMVEVNVFEWFTFDTTFSDTIMKGTQSVSVKLGNSRAASDSVTIVKATFPVDQSPASVKAAVFYLNDEYYFRADDKTGEWRESRSGFTFRSSKGTFPQVQIMIDTKGHTWSAKIAKADFYRFVSVHDGLMVRLEYNTEENPDTMILLGRQHGFMIDEVMLKQNSGYRN
jgi:hypothetical protein